MKKLSLTILLIASLATIVHAQKMNEKKWVIEIPEVHIAQEISSPDRVLRGEVYENTWPLVPLGKKRFEKGPLKLTLGTKGGADASLEIKSVILKRVD